ncbi:aspartyl-tRNA(Asn)/glutamyl-tRNA(Gln) amidotransferase subunit A [Actinobaculum suis]|uniref:Glutamyl-tRNA(Gln) amidotransferase subunit A n=1 Tax=Actinobaculum suis TaxID=1657 RepID=A0A1G7DES9_9ACTO|nr:amidase family protein [Actinobaculum suis]MDY5154105.1 amidase family protein [Actinobaculum suis]SDE50023.1 aspartyl-tRNA(Asn)/glutamyl-tRNA(Gln) amidotransferase subunit A [Actinobaculum suis]
MKDVLKKTAAELSVLLRARELTSVELTEAVLERIAAVDPKINAFLYVDREGALATAREVDAAREAGEALHPLAGIPIAIKDNIVTRGVPTTAASKILEGWKPPYDATVIQKIKAAKLPIVGKTNLDEFAMGSSTEHSAFGATKNPWDTSRIPGGSGGGSAAAVSAFMVPWALGSDTGGSIRQPGAVTGTVGAKPTYGAVSRFGLIAMASSLDQIGPVARTVEDAALLQELISGHDPHDSTSLPDPVAELAAAARTGAQSVAAASAESGTSGAEPVAAAGTSDAEDAESAAAASGTDSAQPLAGLRIGLVAELEGEGYQEGVLASFHAAVEKLEALGAQTVEISCPSFTYALPAYYLIQPAEVSSNLARFDGMRYGIRVEPKKGPVTAETVMRATRAAGFGHEVKRRIILGTQVLSAGAYDQFYGAALKVRTLVQRDLEKAFTQADVILSPTAPEVAFEFGAKSDDPLAMYLNDASTIPANLAGVPAMSVPSGLADGLPVGLQVMAPARADALMYKVAGIVEKVCGRLAATSPAQNWEE